MNAWKQRALWFAWWGYVLVLTHALLRESRLPSGTTEAVREHWFLFSKAAHVGAYAVFAVLSGLLDVARPRRWLLLLVMSLHAMGGEYCQQFVETRHASWRDVGLDHIGLVLGIAVTWKWWRVGPHTSD